MLPPPRFWADTWPTDLPGAFDKRRAHENAAYIEHHLGTTWVANGAARGGPHLLHQDWHGGGPDAFLRLNTLAEDLRAVADTPGLPDILRELKVAKQFQSTAHTLHTSALFARAGNSVSQFYNPRNESLPDFELLIATDRVPAEAKQLTQSEPERLFVTRASALKNDLLKDVLIGDVAYPEIRVMVKDSRQFPDPRDVMAAVRDGLAHRAVGGDEPHAVRSGRFNVFFSAAAAVTNMTESVVLHVAAPRDDKEDERVERLVNKANKQLKRNTAGREPALMCLALGRHQDPYAVAAVIERKFAANVYRSTSGVMLHRFAAMEGPMPRTIVDLIGFVGNPNAYRAIGDFRLSGIGITEGLLENTPVDGTISCYSIGIARGRLSGPTGRLGLSPLFRASTNMFA